MPLTPDTLAALALLVLVALPGLTIVRASFSYVPLLSVSYWLVSWGWISPRGPGRSAFLLASLAFFGLLAALRLLKPLGLVRPAPATLLVVAVSLVRLAPLWMWPVAPGLAAGFDAASTLLLTWHDGVPRTLQPLYPLDGLGHDGFGVPAFAADLALLSGVAAPRAHLLALLASEGLLALAAFGVARRSQPPAVAASVAAFAPALVAAISSSIGLPSSAVLSLALALAGIGLVARGDEWPTTVAGGLFLGAAAVAHGAVGVGAWATAGLLGAARWKRPATALVLALVLALPALWRGVSFPRLPAAGALVLLLPLVGLAWGLQRPRLARWALALGLFAVVLTGVDWAGRSREIAVGPGLQKGAAWLRGHRPPLAVVCAEDFAVRAWLPALSGHPVEPPWIPASAAPRLAPALRPRPGCSIEWTEVLTFSDETPAEP